MKWAIYDGDRRYIAISFDSERAAKMELEDLLKPYPPTHEWRRRLKVGAWPPLTAPVIGFDPPYGYIRDNNRHGSFLRPFEYETRVLRELKKMDDLQSAEAARRLNSQGYHTRERKRFSAAYVDRLRKDMT